MGVAPSQRFTNRHPCPVCAGYEQAPRGRGERCFGFLSDDGEWANCTREDAAGGLTQNAESGTYAHRLTGDCKCAVRHDPRPPQRGGSSTRSRIVAAYDYTDEQGNRLFQSVRYEPKTFRVRRPDGKGGWIWNFGDVRRVLYRLPEVVAADTSDSSFPIFVTEGEKDADRVASLGLTATTNPLGAGKWRMEFGESLRGRRVVILSDNDDEGREHAQQVAQSLWGVAASIKVVELPDLPEKGDVSDFLDQGREAEDLEKLALNAPEWAPGENAKTEEGAPTSYEAKQLDDLLAGEDEPLDAIITDGADGAVLTTDGKGIIAGPTGLGKTNLLLRASRSFCEASPFLGYPVPRPRRVLYVALEGSPRAMRRRLRKVWADADPEARQRFYVAHITLNLAEEADLARLDALIDSVRPEVLIIDPLRNSHPWDENISHETAKLTGILDGIIARHHCALILAHHDRKRPPFAKTDAGIDRVRGSTALTGWLSFCLSMDADVSTTKDRLVLHWTKTRDAEEPLDWLVVQFDRNTINFTPVDDAVPGGKVSDDAILTAVFQSGGSARGPDLVQGFVEGAGASDRWVRERIRALVRDGKLIDYIAPADSKTGAKSYRLPDEETAPEMPL